MAGVDNVLVESDSTMVMLWMLKDNYPWKLNKIRNEIKKYEEFVGKYCFYDYKQRKEHNC